MQCQTVSKGLILTGALGLLLLVPIHNTYAVERVGSIKIVDIGGKWYCKNHDRDYANCWKIRNVQPLNGGDEQSKTHIGKNAEGTVIRIMSGKTEPVTYTFYVKPSESNRVECDFSVTFNPNEKDLAKVFTNIKTNWPCENGTSYMEGGQFVHKFFINYQDEANR